MQTFYQRAPSRMERSDELDRLGCMPAAELFSRGFEAREPSPQAGVDGLDGDLLRAFGMDIPLDRAVYLLRSSPFEIDDRPGSMVHFDKVQILDADRSGLFALPVGSDPLSGAVHFPIGRIGRICVPPRATSATADRLDENTIFPNGQSDAVYFAGGTVNAFGMELPVDRDVEIILRDGSSQKVRPIFHSRDGRLIVRRGESPCEGPCHSLESSRIVAARFRLGSLEARPEWAAPVNAHAENRKSVPTEREIGFENRFRYSLDTERPVEGIVGSYIKAFGALIPLDRPVEIHVEAGSGYRNCQAQIVDISERGDVYFFPLPEQYNEGGYLHWGGLHQGALQLPKEYVRAVSYTADPEIEPKPGEAVLFPARGSRLYDLSELTHVEVHGNRFPIDREMSIETIDGRVVRGKLIYSSYIGDLLLRPEDNPVQGGCLKVPCALIDRAVVRPSR